MDQEYRFREPEFPQQAAPTSVPGDYPLPPEYSAPGAETAPLPAEYGQAPLVTESAGRTSSVRRLIVCSLAVSVIATASVGSVLTEDASGDEASAPVDSVISETIEILPDIPIIEDIVEDVTEPIVEIVDLYQGLTDAEVLIACSPWQSESISATFLENGHGFWTGGDRYGTMTWVEQADGSVAYTGSAVLFNADSSDSSSGISSAVDTGDGLSSDDVYFNDLSAIFYAEIETCSGVAFLDRTAGTVELGNPLRLEDKLYVAGNSSVDDTLSRLVSLPEEVLRNGSWEPADGRQDGISGVTFNEDGTAVLTYNGLQYSCAMDHAGTYGDAGTHLFNRENGSLFIEVNANSTMELSMGLNMLLGIRDGQPILVFFDGTIFDTFDYRVFTRPDLKQLLYPESAEVPGETVPEE